MVVGLANRMLRMTPGIETQDAAVSGGRGRVKYHHRAGEEVSRVVRTIENGVGRGWCPLRGQRNGSGGGAVGICREFNVPEQAVDSNVPREARITYSASPESMYRIAETLTGSSASIATAISVARAKQVARRTPQPSGAAVAGLSCEGTSGRHFAHTASTCVAHRVLKAKSRAAVFRCTELVASSAEISRVAIARRVSMRYSRYFAVQSLCAVSFHRFMKE